MAALGSGSPVSSGRFHAASPLQHGHSADPSLRICESAPGGFAGSFKGDLPSHPPGPEAALAVFFLAHLVLKY